MARVMGDPWARTLYTYICLREIEHMDTAVREGERLDAMYKTFTAAGAVMVGSDEGVKMLDDVRDEYLGRMRATAPETDDERMDRMIEAYKRNEALNVGFEDVERAATFTPVPIPAAASEG